MKLICNRTELERGLGLASQAVATRTPQAILQCVRITAEGSTATLQATDLQVSVRVALGMVDVTEDGETAVSADTLRKIVANSQDETLTLQTEGTRLFVKGADATFEIYGVDVGEFPPVADFTDEAALRAPAGQLRDLVKKVQYAAAKENTRYAINGVWWELKGKQLHLVATDGRRMARSWASVDEADGDRGAIVPLSAIGLLSNLLGSGDEPVALRIDDRQAIFQTRNAVLATQLVEGRFPDYESVIPKDNDKKVEFATGELLSAVRRAALLTSEESRGVKFAFGDGKLTLTSQVPESGRAEITLSCNYTGQPFVIGFNPDFLVEALRVADSDTVTFELKDPAKPGVMKVGQSFMYVVMPLSLST